MSKMRRFLSGFLGFLLLAFIVSTSVFVSADADHDCEGAGCHVCAELQMCLANLNVGGMSTTDAPSPSPGHNVFKDIPAPCAYWPQATTLRSLDVRWNE